MSEDKRIVTVHKASISLNSGETIHQYISKLSKQGREYCKKKLGIGDKSGYVYVEEAFGDNVVFDVCKSGDVSEIRKYYGTTYKRNGDDFEFGDLVEVEKITSFKPVNNPITISKAVWTTAYINDLPDAAFAVILPGGKKDKDGKTVPRSLRKLPHHNANVKSPTENNSVDLPHLRNGLARAPQADLSAAQKSRAISHLNAHAKKLLTTRKPVKKDFWDGAI